MPATTWLAAAANHQESPVGRDHQRIETLSALLKPPRLRHRESLQAVARSPIT
jgi:hypothetical protein